MIASAPVEVAAQGAATADVPVAAHHGNDEMIMVCEVLLALG